MVTMTAKSVGRFVGEMAADIGWFQTAVGLALFLSFWWLMLTSGGWPAVVALVVAVAPMLLVVLGEARRRRAMIASQPTPDEAALQWVLAPLKPELLRLEHDLIGAGAITSPGILHAHYEDCRCSPQHRAELSRTTLESFSRRHCGVMAVHTLSQADPVFYVSDDGARFTPDKDNPLKGWEQ